MKKQKPKKKVKKKKVKFEFFYRKTKVCIACGKVRKRNKYKKNKSRADGLEDICKRCKNSQVYTHPSLQFLNKKEDKKTSRKKAIRKLRKLYKYILKEWKKDKKGSKPTFDKKNLVIHLTRSVQVKKKKEKKFSLKKFAKKHNVNVVNIKQKLKKIKKHDRIVKLRHELAAIKVQYKKLKNNLKLKKKKMKLVKCLQKGCTRKEWIPKNSKALNGCSKCMVEILAGKRRDKYVGQTPRNRKKAKLLWKQKQKKISKKKKA